MFVLMMWFSFLSPVNNHEPSRLSDVILRILKSGLLLALNITVEYSSRTGGRAFPPLKKTTQLATSYSTISPQQQDGEATCHAKRRERSDCFYFGGFYSITAMVYARNHPIWMHFGNFTKKVTTQIQQPFVDYSSV